MSPRPPTRQWCEANPGDAAQLIALAIAELAEVREFAGPERLPALRRRERGLRRRLAEVEEPTP